MRLSKIIFSILFCLILAGSVWGRGDYYKGAQTVSGCSIPGSPDVSFETHDTSNTLSDGIAEGQTFASGSGGTLAQMCVNIEYLAGDGRSSLTMRIDSDSDLSDGDGYVEEFSYGAITAAGGSGWKCVESSVNPSISASTTYYIAVMLNGTAGDFKWYRDTNAGYGDGSAINPDSGWTLGSPYVERDENFRIYYCE